MAKPVYVLTFPADPVVKRPKATQRAFTSPSKAFIVGRSQIEKHWPESTIENADGATEKLRAYAISHLALWDEVTFYGIQRDAMVDNFTIHRLIVE